MTINYELLSEKPMEEILNESKINYDSIKMQNAIKR